MTTERGCTNLRETARSRADSEATKGYRAEARAALVGVWSKEERAGGECLGGGDVGWKRRGCGCSRWGSGGGGGDVQAGGEGGAGGWAWAWAWAETWQPEVAGAGLVKQRGGGRQGAGLWLSGLERRSGQGAQAKGGCRWLASLKLRGSAVAWAVSG